VTKGEEVTVKIRSIIGLLLLGILLGPVAVMAQTTVIDDSRNGANSYWGGTAPWAQDVIYPPSLNPNTGWDINRMEVTDTGTKIQVKIIGPWFSGDAVGDPRTPGYLGGLFYNSGDLYISSSGWHVDNTSGSPHYSQDTFKQSEGWNYVVTNRKQNEPGEGWGYQSGVYALDFNAVDYTKAIKYTQGWPSDLGRSDQAYYGGYGAKIEGATVTFGGTGDTSYELYEFDKFLSGDIGFHYTMYCGNDVIEGQATLVPEPGSLFLLGFALMGLGFCRRRVWWGWSSLDKS
jgi:hypothetical protein